MTPESRRGLRLLACLALCAFEWLPLRELEVVIGHRVADGLLLSCLWSVAVMELCCVILTPCEQRRA